MTVTYKYDQHRVMRCCGCGVLLLSSNNKTFATRPLF
jgi:hypothetical protein